METSFEHIFILMIVLGLLFDLVAMGFMALLIMFGARLLLPQVINLLNTLKGGSK